MKIDIFDGRVYRDCRVCMCVWTCTHIFTGINAHTHTQIQTHTHTHTQMQTHTNTHKHTQTHTNTRKHTHIRSHAHKHTYKNTHTHKHTHTLTQVCTTPPHVRHTHYYCCPHYYIQLSLKVQRRSNV